MKVQQQVSHFLLAVLVCLVALGCERKQSAALSVANHGGGDTSGGELRASSEEAVDQAIRKLRQNLELVFLRLASAQKHNLAGHALLDKLFHSSSEPLSQTLARIQLRPINGDCYGDGKWKAASIDDNGNLCLSRRQLAMRPPEVLEKELVALAAHEVGHARKLSEAECQVLQDYLALNRNFLETDVFIIRQHINAFRNLSEMAAKLVWAIISPGVFPPLVCERFSQFSFAAEAPFFLGYQKRGVYPIPSPVFFDLSPTLANVAVHKDSRGCFFAFASPEEKRAAYEEAIDLAKLTQALSRDIETFLVPHGQDQIKNTNSLGRAEMYLLEAEAKRAALDAASNSGIGSTGTPRSSLTCSLWNNAKEQIVDQGIYEEPSDIRHAASFQTTESLREFGEVAGWLREIQFISLKNSFWSPDLEGFGITISYKASRPDLSLQTLDSSKWFVPKGRGWMGVQSASDQGLLNYFNGSIGILHPVSAREARWDFQIVDGNSEPLVPETFSIRCKLE